MNIKEYKLLLKEELNNFKEKQQIKFNEFKEKQQIKLEKFKNKNNKKKRGGVGNVVGFFNPKVLTIDEYMRTLDKILKNPNGGISEFIKTIIVDLNIMYKNFDINEKDINELKNKINSIIERSEITDNYLNDIIQNILSKSNYENLNPTIVKNFFNLY